MIFNSIEFLFFFLPITYLVFWMLKTANARYVWLTITGYIFYGWWDARFCLLIGFSTLVSFLAGLGFLRWQEGWQRRLCLIVPIVMDLLQSSGAFWFKRSWPSSGHYFACRDFLLHFPYDQLHRRLLPSGGSAHTQSI